MSNKLTDRALFGGVLDPNDLFHIVDVNNFTQDPAGSSFKLKLSQLFSFAGNSLTNVLAAGNITGGKDIIITTNDKIKSASGSAYLSLLSGVAGLYADNSGNKYINSLITNNALIHDIKNTLTSPVTEIIGVAQIGDGTTSTLSAFNSQSESQLNIQDAANPGNFGILTIKLGSYPGGLTGISTNNDAFFFNKDFRGDKAGKWSLYRNGAGGLGLYGANDVSGAYGITIAATGDATFGAKAILYSNAASNLEAVPLQQMNAALTGYLKRDGSTTLTGPWDTGGNTANYILHNGINLGSVVNSIAGATNAGLLIRNSAAALVATFGAGPSTTSTFAGKVILNADAVDALGAVTYQQLQAWQAGLWDDRGNFTPAGNYPSTGGSGTAGAILKGDIWTISGLGVGVPGTMGSKTVFDGDTVRALIDSPGNTNANWSEQEGALGYAPVSNVLNSARIFVGNASNVATGVAVSGDITITNAGIVAIGANKVTSAMLASMTSAQLAGVISDETGTGLLVFNNSPTFITPILGVASATSYAVSGTGGNGFVSHITQSSPPASLANGAGARMFADASGRHSWISNGFVKTFDGLANTADRIYTLPDYNSIIATLAGTETFTNKRWTARVNTIASSATPSINTDATDLFTITAQAAAITSMTTNLTGTPSNGDLLMIRILDNGTARAITWGASFASRGATLPTTTVLGKYLYVGLVWNSTTSTWDCIAAAQE